MLIRCSLALALLGCAGPERPSILLITLDTTRADHLGPYGGAIAETPTYDRLAEEGMVFLRAYSSAPLTIVSHATILTGRAPPAHGVRNNGDYVLGEDQRTLAERLRAAGWHTAAFTSAFPTQARWGFAQGFDTYHDPLARLPTQLDWRDERSADQVVDDALRTLSAVDGEVPLFVWVHLFDAHWPYRPPEPYRARYAEHLYDGEIAFASDQVGRLLEAWDRLRPESVVLLTADHGEGLGDGGERTHGYLLHDGTIRVPLLLRGHGRLADALPAGARVQDPVGHVDIAPTLLALAGLPLDDALQGQDLRQGGSEAVWSEALTPQHNLGLAPLFSRTDARGRYTRGGWGAFYAAEGEVIPVTPDPSAPLAPEEERLEALRASIGEVEAPSTTLDADALAQLQALGYIGGDPAAVAGDVDPRDVIDLIPLTWELRRFLRARPALAEAMLAKLEARMPGAWGVELLRAELLRAQGRLPEAVERTTDLWLRSPSATTALRVAELWRALDEPAEALGWYQEALALQPNSPEALLGVALCARMLGDEPEAAAVAESALVAFPDHAEMVLLRAQLLLETGQVEEAAEEASWALERLPRQPLAWLVAAEARWQLGESEEAIALLQSALELDRGDLGVRLRLVECLLDVERRTEARRALRPAWRLLPEQPRVRELAAALGLEALDPLAR